MDERDGAVESEGARWDAGPDGGITPSWRRSGTAAIGRAEVRAPYADLLPQPEYPAPSPLANGVPMNGSRFAVPQQPSPAAEQPPYEPSRYERHEQPRYDQPRYDQPHDEHTHHDQPAPTTRTPPNYF